jgi:hypothetical protein
MFCFNSQTSVDKILRFNYDFIIGQNSFNDKIKQKQLPRNKVKKKIFFFTFQIFIPLQLLQMVKRQLMDIDAQ